MSHSELVMYAILAAGAVAYLVLPRVWALIKKVNPASVEVHAAPVSGDRVWLEHWVTTLMRLQDELGEDGRECCVPLARELIWRLMGGEPNDVPARVNAGKK